MRGWALRQLGAGKASKSKESGSKMTGSVAEITPAALSHHAFLLGTTGTGKSRLTLHLLTEQLRSGCSAVILDPKAETIDHVTACAKLAGLTPDQVVLLRPGNIRSGVPGWNPLATGVPLHLAAVDIVSVLEKSTTSWGPRLADILTNSLVVLAAYRLSLYELPRLLSNDDYRTHLLESDSNCETYEDRIAFTEAKSFLVNEFASWSKADRSNAIAPVLNKTRELLRSAFLQALFCASTNTLDLSALWQRQKVVLVHLDSSVLGEEGTRLLSGLVAHQLHRTAMRFGHDSKVPVVLCVDELGVQESFLGSAIKDILAIARSKNLRLLAAFQYFTQLPAELREALMSQCSVQAYFRLGHPDARLVAASLGAVGGDRISQVNARVAEIDKLTQRAKRTTWRQKIFDGNGKPLSVEPLAWQMRVYRDSLCMD
jgi:type IV secretory pathway TraG/TraD family ATPase VirD4